MHLEVLRVTIGELLLDGLCFGLNQLILNLGLRGSSLKELGWSLVTAKKFISDSLNLLDLLLGLSCLDKGLNSALIGITCLKIFLNFLLLHDLLDDFLTLLTMGDASVRVFQQGNKLVFLLKVGVIGFEVHEEGHTESENSNEADETQSLSNVLLELLGRLRRDSRGFGLVLLHHGLFSVVKKSAVASGLGVARPKCLACLW